MKPGVDYDAFLMPTIETGTQPSIITEVATLPVSKRAPDSDAAMTVMKNWLNPKVQAAWMSFLADIPPNPQVPSTDPVVKNVIRQVKERKPRLLIRYWEASPPPLIEGNVQDLGGFMIHPDNPEKVLRKMQDRADTEWDYWRSET
jgi:multiple sugar transport system substrate-binding protein